MRHKTRGKKGGRRRTKPQLLIKPAATGRQMAGCTCASLTQLRLSCPFDDSLPGVASWASTGGGGGTAGGAAPLVHHRRPPRKHDGSRRSGVGRCQPASALWLRAVSCPCQSRSRRWRKRKSPATQPQSGWHGERRGGSALSQERPSRAHSCHTSGRPTPSLNKTFTVTVGSLQGRWERPANHQFAGNRFSPQSPRVS